MHKEFLTVVIPIHEKVPPPLEQISLTQTLKIFHRHTITFQAQADLDVSWYEEFCKGKGKIRFERFTWKGHQQYGLLHSRAFYYERFLDYKFLFLVHMDAFAFRDEIDKWCESGYDFVGCIIYNRAFKKMKPDSLFRKVTGFTTPEYFFNGGFGLKNVRSFYDITKKYKWYIDLYHFIRKLRGKPFYDDLFFLQHFTKLQKSFRFAPVAVAKDFGASVEDFDVKDLPFDNHDNNLLPFGVHGFIKLHLDFWKPCIRRCGYDI